MGSSRDVVRDLNGPLKSSCSIGGTGEFLRARHAFARRGHGQSSRRQVSKRPLGSPESNDRQLFNAGSSRIEVQPQLRDAEGSWQPPKPVRHGGHAASSATFHSSNTFEDLGATPQMISALQSIGIRRPSYIQSASLKAFGQGGHLLLADHAGSGKTLAYLIPVMQHLRKHEDLHGSRIARPNSPAAVILAPTQELCAQVRAVAKALAGNGLPFRIRLMTGGPKGKQTQREALQGGPDIVIGTPGRLSELMQAGLLKLDRCQALVLDEVDILTGEASLFREQVEPFLQAQSPSLRAILVTASISQMAWTFLQADFPSIKPVLGPGLHRPAPGSLEQLIDCSGGDEINELTAYKRKASAMLQLIKSQPTKRTIIFCNKLPTCRQVENTLLRSLTAEFQILPYHAAIEDARRQSNLMAFMDPEQGRKILVCTDRASRGLDTSLVEHVIMFDFPRDPSEYLRRAGRTARGAGGKGTVSMLVLGRQVKLAKQILDRNESGQPLHGLPSV